MINREQDKINFALGNEQTQTTPPLHKFQFQMSTEQLNYSALWRSCVYFNIMLKTESFVFLVTLWIWFPEVLDDLSYWEVWAFCPDALRFLSTAFVSLWFWIRAPSCLLLWLLMAGSCNPSFFFSASCSSAIKTSLPFLGLVYFTKHNGFQLGSFFFFK